MKGRTPTPAETRKRAGNVGHRSVPEPARVSQRVIADEDGATDAQVAVLEQQVPVPPHLDGDPEARELWLYYGTLLASAGVLEVSDALALEGLVEAEVLTRRSMRALEAERELQADREQRRLVALEQLEQLDVGDEARAELRRALDADGHGVVIAGTTGQLVTHPAFRTWRDARAVFLRYAEQLGLTPVARTRLGVLGLAGRKLQRDLEAQLPDHPRGRSRS